LLFEQSYRGAVKVRYIGFKDISGDVVLVHEFGVGMTIGTELRGS
jgi:hypothetical protein